MPVSITTTDTLMRDTLGYNKPQLSTYPVILTGCFIEIIYQIISVSLYLNSAHCKCCCWASSNLMSNVTHRVLYRDDRQEDKNGHSYVKLDEDIVKR